MAVPAGHVILRTRGSLAGVKECNRLGSPDVDMYAMYLNGTPSSELRIGPVNSILEVMR